MRVVVTGMGAVAPNGNSVSEYWDALTAGQSGIDHITYFDTTDFPVKIAGEVSNFDPEQYFERKEVRKLDPFSVYALVASNEAMLMSGLDAGGFDPQRAGVMLGCGIGGITTLLAEHMVLINRGARRVQQIALRGPVGVPVNRSVHGDAPLGAATERDEVEVAVSVALGVVDKPLAIGGPARVAVVVRVVGDLPRVTAIAPHDPDVVGLAPLRLVGNPLSVERPARAVLAAVARRQPYRLACRAAVRVDGDLPDVERTVPAGVGPRPEERRGGEGCRARWSPEQSKKKKPLKDICPGDRHLIYLGEESLNLNLQNGTEGDLN